MSVIESFCKREKVQRKEVDDGIVKFSELDNILLGLDAAEFIPLFGEQGVKLETFLQLNECDLEKIGVDKARPPYFDNPYSNNRFLAFLRISNFGLHSSASLEYENNVPLCYRTSMMSVLDYSEILGRDFVSSS